MAGATKTGSEFRINTTTRGAQLYSDVAALANGGFVVAFTSPSIKLDNTFGANDIYGRIYGSNYLPATSEFVIASQPLVSQVFDGSVALAVRGSGFVAAWNSPFDDSPSSIMAETFNASGSGGGDFEVNQGSNDFHFPDVATSTSGNYLVVWGDAAQSGTDTSGSAILAKVNGTGALITINTTTAGDQTAVSVSALQGGSGNYAVTWRSVNPVTQDVDIKAQIVSAAGGKVGGEITVAADVYSGESTQVAGLVGGGFAIAYFDRYTIKGKVFDANGAALTGSFDISPPNGYYAPAIAGLSNRLIAVAYEYFNDFQAMYVKTLAPDGTQIGSTLTFDANNGVQAGANYAGQPSIAALANGKFVITWTDISGDFEVGATEPLAAIVGQIYSSTAPVFIDGNAANNSFNGAAQTGFFLGYNGIDTVSYAAASAGVVANMANAAANTGAAAGDGFGNSIEILVGSAFADTLVGNALANTLNGGGLGDAMRGGAGNDVYLVDNASDVVDEQSNGGAGTADLVQSSISFSLANTSRVFDAVENLTLVNVAAALTATGNSLNNIITGNNFNNTLNGGLGVDSLRGLLGNDTYVLENGFDAIIDTGGIDTVTSTISRSIAGYTTVENLTLVNVATALTAIGNNLNNIITGNNYNNTLIGGLGVDSLRGGLGNDTYVLENGADGIIDTGGVDTVTSTISRSIAGYTTVENLLLVNVAAALAGTGNNLNNVITGNNFNNTLIGNAGNDTLRGLSGLDKLYGGAGNDSLTGGAGVDYFVFNTTPNSSTNRDVMSDFVHGGDKIWMENAVFTKLGAAGALNGAFFWNGTAAHDANDTIVYNRATGALYYDGNGNAAGGAVQFATLLNKPVLSAGDFVVI